uniref:Uncharacterized protein n=1 Tax=Cucumis sativus TaxID=3659 RepID=A0A0A0KEK3_CUCSA
MAGLVEGSLINLYPIKVEHERFDRPPPPPPPPLSIIFLNSFRFFSPLPDNPTRFNSSLFALSPIYFRRLTIGAFHRNRINFYPLRSFHLDQSNFIFFTFCLPSQEEWPFLGIIQTNQVLMVYWKIKAMDKLPIELTPLQEMTKRTWVQIKNLI